MFKKTNIVEQSLGVIHSLSQAMSRVEDLRNVADKLVEEISKIFKVEKVSVMIYQQATDSLRIIAAKGVDRDVVEKSFVRRGEGISGKVFSSSEPLLIKDIRSSAFDGRGNYHTYSLMSSPVTCFPMLVGDRPLGVINVTDRVDGKSFSKADLDLLNTIANQMAVYLHLLKLADEARVNEGLQRELEIARQIQYRLLPPFPMKMKGVDVYGRLITAQRVGGDYYDCYQINENEMSFMVADVSGHSVGAGIVMAAFRAAVRSQLDQGLSPASLAKRVNKILFSDLYQAEQFITFVNLYYYKLNNELVCTVAGHPRPLIWHGADSKFSTIESDDTCLGIEETSDFHETKMKLSKGDVVVLYTDGVSEAMNAKGESFGNERLKNCIKDSIGGSAKQMAEVIVENVQSFIDPLPLKDDVTALVVKIL